MEGYAWLILDLFAVILLILAVRYGAAKGFLRSIMGIIGFIAAAVLARLLSGPLADLLYRHVIRDSLRIFIENRLDAMALEGGLDFGGINALDALPLLARLLISRDSDRIYDLDSLARESSDGGVSSELISSIVDNTLADPIIAALSSGIFVILLILGVALSRRIARTFGGAYRIPLIGSVNTLLGGILGLIEGGIALYVIGIILRFIISMNNGSVWVISSYSIESSIVFRLFVL